MSTNSSVAQSTFDSSDLIPSDSIEMTTAVYTSRAVGSYLLLFALVFGIAASVNRRSLPPQVANNGAWMTTVFIQFVILPAVGFGLVKALGLGFASGITLLLITTSPGGAYSNWFCSVFNGDVALSITLTSISTMIGIVLIPCNLILYTANAYGEESVDSIPWGSVYVSIFVILAATFMGLYCSARLDSTPFNVIANSMGHISGGSLVLFTIIVIVYADGTEINLFGQSWGFYIGVASPCVVGLILSLVFSAWFNLAKPERISVALECFYQNHSIGTALALAMFKGDTLSNVLAIPLYYGIVQFVVMFSYCIIVWKLGWTKAPKDVTFWMMILKPYEVLSLENKEPKERDASSTNDVRVISDAHVVNVVDEFVDNVFVDVELGSPIIVNLSQDNTTDVYVDDDPRVKKPKKFIFGNKAKVMDAQAPTISPTSVLAPEAFAHSTAKKAGSFKRKKKFGRKSHALKELMIEETINEDSLAEDPDISIAGESDLESGLSVSVYGEDISLSGFSATRPSSQASKRNKNRINNFTSQSKNQDNIENLESMQAKHTDTTEPEQDFKGLPLVVDVSDSAIDQFDEVSLHENEVSVDKKHTTNTPSPDIKSPLQTEKNENQELSNEPNEIRAQRSDAAEKVESSTNKSNDAATMSLEEQASDIVDKPAESSVEETETVEAPLEDNTKANNEQTSIMQETAEEEIGGDDRDKNDEV